MLENIQASSGKMSTKKMLNMRWKIKRRINFKQEQKCSIEISTLCGIFFPFSLQWLVQARETFRNEILIWIKGWFSTASRNMQFAWLNLLKQLIQYYIFVSFIIMACALFSPISNTQSREFFRPRKSKKRTNRKDEVVLLPKKTAFSSHSNHLN